MLDDAVWIFKWFITCFIYSFPLEVVKYVWDLVVERGALGLIYMGVAVVLEIGEKLMEIDDGC